MVKQLYKLLLGVSAFLIIGCECPYLDDLDRAQLRKNTGNEFCADNLLGIWQCSYNMTVAGLDFKEIKFMSNGKADIVMAQQHDTEWYTETFNYAYYGNTLRFSKGRTNFSFTIKGWLCPELYLYDSFGTYTITLRRVFSN